MDKKFLPGGKLAMTNTKSSQSLGPISASATSRDAQNQFSAQPPEKAVSQTKRLQPENKLCYEEMLSKEKIHPIEDLRLKLVFQRFENATFKPGKENNVSSGRERPGEDDNKSEVSKQDKKAKLHNAKLEQPQYKPHFTAEDVDIILRELGYEATKEEIDNMIWEVDEDLDRKIDEREFKLMFQRCIREDSQLEPKALFHLVRFLMFIHTANTNKFNDVRGDFKGTTSTLHEEKKKTTITQEDTLELIFVREMDIRKMEAVLETIFGYIAII